MTASRPDVIAKKAKELDRRTGHLLTEYRWAWNLAYSSAPARAIGVPARGRGQDQEGGPVARVHEAQGWVTERMEEAEARLDEALEAVKTARDRLSVFSGGSKGKPDQDVKEISKQERRAAEEARRRRMARGEGWGEG